MKKIITLSLLIILGINLIAQDADKGDKKSKIIIDRFTAKTEAYKSFKAEFTYKMENIEASINESTEGKLTVMGESYMLDIAGQKVLCNGETVWTYIEDAEEVQINSVEDSEESISPNKLLTSYNEDYRSKFVKEDFLYGTTVNIIDLTPVEGKSYYKIRLIINKSNDQLMEISIFDKNGSTYSYIIKIFEPNVDVSEDAFTFKESDYPDVDIIDMR